MSAQKQDEKENASNESKSLTNKDGSVTKLTEWATAGVESVDDMIALFGDSGVSYSEGEEATGDYRFIGHDEKVAFCKRVLGKRAFVVRWEFREGDNGEYVSIYLIIDGAGKFLLNDGAKTGMYGQLSDVSSVRIDQGKSESEAHAGLLVARGLKQNKPYQYNKKTNKAIKKGEDVPESDRAWAKETFRFDF